MHYAYPVVEQVAFVAVEQSPYNIELVGQNIRAQLRAEQNAINVSSLLQEFKAVRDDLVQLRADVRNIQNTLYGATSVPAPQAPPAAPPEPPPADTPAPPVLPTEPPAPAPDPNAVPTSDLNGWSLQLLATRCASCHNAAKKSGDFYLFEAKLADGTWPQKPFTAADLVLIDEVLYSNEMPKPPHAKLDQKEYSRIRAWRNQYSPAVRQLARTGPAVPIK